MKNNASESSHSVIAVTWPFLAGMMLMLLISLGSIGYLAVRRILNRTAEMATTLQATEKLAFEEHQRAAVLLSSIGDAVISTDRLGIVKFLNSAESS